VDFKFVDFLGTWNHYTIPAKRFSEEMFEEGLGFDGSSVRGFQAINESDMLLVPDRNTAFLDPFTAMPTLSFICYVKDPVTGEWYSRDPRRVATKAEEYLKKTGVAEISYWGPELEFFVFDDVRYEAGQHQSFYSVDSVEGVWNTGTDEGPNLAHKIRNKQGYFPVAPTDQMMDIRSEMCRTMMDIGIEIELHHHEVATAGQAEIDMRFDTMVKEADNAMKYKYVVKNTARKFGKTATFMPKPLFGDNGSGMHVHQSFWSSGKNLFYDPKGYAGLSEMAIHYIGGVLKHAPAIVGFSNPTTNSFKRLVPGFEAPITLVYSQRNRSAAIRIPVVKGEKAKRLETRFPDPSSNPYLVFSALMMAGLDGIQNKIKPPAPLDKDIYELSPEERAKLGGGTPGSLEEALNALEADHEFLLKGDVFTKDVIETWIEYKRVNEVGQGRLRPTPWEYSMYYDV
jgi:glutamine synthetase